jgi:hypothetical protein
LFVFDCHVDLLDRNRHPTGPANGPTSSMKIMPWRFLELKPPPAPRRPRVRLLRPVPRSNDLLHPASQPTHRAA